MVASINKLYNHLTGKFQPDLTNFNDNDEKKQNFIISLTSIPKRNRSLKKTLKSLVSQDYENFSIELNLPKEMKGTVEVQDNKIKVFYVDDIGPITKLFYTLQRHEGTNHKIITVDDDIHYHPEMLKTYGSMRISRSAVGFAGINIVDGKFASVTQVENPTSVDILEGYKSVCYSPLFFERDFFEKYAKLPVFDDALISGYLKRKGIERIVMPHKFLKSYHWFKHFPTKKLFRNPSSGCADLKEKYGDYQENYVEFFNSL